VQQTTIAPTFSAWQRAARQALQSAVPPEQIAWEELSTPEPALPLFDDEVREPEKAGALSACQRPSWRSAAESRAIGKRSAGGCFTASCGASRTASRDCWRSSSIPMCTSSLAWTKRCGTTCTRCAPSSAFRRIAAEEQEWYVAWFEPEHHIVELNSPFFTDRFASMRWSILTPERCAHWDAKALTFTGWRAALRCTTEDSVEELWLQYYSHIFNPGRVKVRAMQAEMPKKYWKNLPEAAVIPALLEEAPRRVTAMIAKSEAKRTDQLDWHPAEPPDTTDIAKLRAAAAGCTACPLYKNATQTVFGEGPRMAQVIFVGEQPGDQEDLQGSLSSGRQVSYWTGRWRRPASTAPLSTSRTP
jgi:DNA polymerase